MKAAPRDAISPLHLPTAPLLASSRGWRSQRFAAVLGQLDEESPPQTGGVHKHRSRRLFSAAYGFSSLLNST